MEEAMRKTALFQTAARWGHRALPPMQYFSGGLLWAWRFKDCDAGGNQALGGLTAGASARKNGFATGRRARRSRPTNNVPIL